MSNDQTRVGAAGSIDLASCTPEISDMASGEGAAAAHPTEVSGGEGGESPPAKVSTALGETAERALEDLRRRLEGGDAAFMDGAAKLCLPPLDWMSQTLQPGQPACIEVVVDAARDRLLANPGWVERLDAFLGEGEDAFAAIETAPPAPAGRPRARCLAMALEYAALGWPVLPLYGIANGGCTCAKNSACPSAGKHPRINNGPKGASVDPAVITRWFQRWPDANVGIVTGGASGLLVLDIDPRHGGNESLAEFRERNGELPATLQANSGGGGRHWFFRCPENRTGNRTNLSGLSGLDLRGDGGYIVAAPSAHASGGSYAWVEGFSREAVLAAPAWLYAVANAKGGGGHAKAAPASHEVTGAPIGEGGRNDTLFRIGCGFRHKGMEADEIRAELLRVNAGRCQPPLGQDEVERIAQSAAAYSPAPAMPAQPLMPIPDDAPAPDTDHPQLGAAASVHTYRDSSGQALWHVCSFWDHGKLTTRPLTFWGDEVETQRWLWKGPGKRHVLYRLRELAFDPAAPVLVVRDEPSADQAAADFPGWAVTCPLFGTFGIRGAEWAALRGRQVLLWSEDADEGRAFVKEAADQIRRVGAARVVVFAHDRRPVEGGGLANGGGDAGVIPTAAAGWTEAHLAALLEATIAPDVSLIDTMNCIRDNRDKLRPHRRDQAAAEYLTESLKARGKFYHEQDIAYYFLAAERLLIALDGENQALVRLLAEFGVNRSETLFGYLAQHLWVEATTRGTPTVVRHLGHYDRRRNAAYVFNQAGLIYKVTPGGIEAVENGADGVLFLQEPEAEPFHMVDDFDPGVRDEHGRDPIQRMLEDGLSLEPGLMTPAQGLTLLRYWIWARFFPELMPTKPILALVGEKGSAKTAAAKRIGTMLFGRNFDVASMTDDVKDFDAAISATSLLVADNADTDRKWLADKLATVATGGRVNKRVLYTTNTMASIKSIAWVILTSRTPHFKRDDVAERLLLLRTRRLDSFRGLSELDRRTVEERAVLMTNLLHDLAEATRAMRDHGDDDISGDVRMADFYAFAVRVARYRGEEDEVKEAFQRLQRAQVGFAAEGDPIAALLEIWLRTPANAGRWIRAAELYRELCEAGERHRRAMPEGMGERSFCHSLAHSLEALRERFSIQDRSRKNTAEYSFRPLAAMAEDI